MLCTYSIVSMPIQSGPLLRVGEAGAVWRRTSAVPAGGCRMVTVLFSCGASELRGGYSSFFALNLLLSSALMQPTSRPLPPYGGSFEARDERS